MDSVILVLGLLAGIAASCAVVSIVVMWLIEYTSPRS